MKSRIILESPQDADPEKTYLLHEELKKMAKELLKNEGYSDDEIKFEHKEEGYTYDVVAFKNNQIDKVIEVGSISAQKLFYCLNKFKENFYCIPYAKHDYLRYTKKTMQEINTDYENKIQELNNEIKNKEEEKEKAVQELNKKIEEKQQQIYAFELLFKRLERNLTTIETTKEEIQRELKEQEKIISNEAKA